MIRLGVLGCCLLYQLAWAGSDLNDAELVPHLDGNGRQAYQKFLASSPHRAFVISPGGGWAWRSGKSSAREARDAAIAACSEYSQYPCVPYAMDQRIVFDAQGWPLLLRPYLSAKEASVARIGLIRGMRFPNLSFASHGGHRVSISDWRGRVVILHFWGSWCPSCQRELPNLAALAKQLKSDSRFLIATTQIRESPDSARAWLERAKIVLPLYDSGEINASSDTLRLADGSTLQDRLVSPVFPTTYILDREGIVVFSHQGPIDNWLQYRPFLGDIAANSGK